MKKKSHQMYVCICVRTVPLYFATKKKEGNVVAPTSSLHVVVVVPFFFLEKACNYNCTRPSLAHNLKTNSILSLFFFFFRGHFLFYQLVTSPSLVVHT